MVRLHQVATDSKDVVYRSMDREEVRDLSQRLEAARVAFALTPRTRVNGNIDSQYNYR
jgi:extradiol dioxygenase family protein